MPLATLSHSFSKGTLAKHLDGLLYRKYSLRLASKMSQSTLPWTRLLLLVVSCLLGLVSSSTMAATQLQTNDNEHNGARTSNHLLVRRRLDDNTDSITASTLNFLFSLAFLNDASASGLESLNPNDEDVIAFCEAVHEQAGGNRVKLEASLAGIIVDSVNDCRIVSTQRVLDGAALFRLELQVTQTVESTSSDLDLLKSLVESGFVQTDVDGSNILLKLLQESPVFAQLSDVTLLMGAFSSPMPTTASPTLAPSFRFTLFPTVDVTTLAPTTMAPTTMAPTTMAPTTMAPTTMPPTTMAPSITAPTTLTPTTMAPTTMSPSKMAPTTLAPIFVAPTTLTPTTTAPTTMAPSLRGTSVAPSAGGSSATPSFAPSAVPSIIPTIADADSVSPSLTPTVLPSAVDGTSNLPSMVEPSSNLPDPSASPSTTPVVAVIPIRQEGLSSLEIAAIVGGIVVFLCMCCCFGLWYCRCCRRRHVDDEASLDDDDDDAPLQSKPTRRPIVPDMVQLDDDNQSLANTTLGEHTAGRRPPPRKRLMSMNDSFDDSSIYTSPDVKLVLASRLTSNDSVASSTVSKRFPSLLLTGRHGANLKEQSSDDEGDSILSSLGGEGQGPSTVASNAESGWDSGSSSDKPQSSNDDDDDDSSREEGILGAAATSPISAKIEALVAAELDDDEASSTSTTSYKSFVSSGYGESSPLGLSKLGGSGSNVVIANDDDDDDDDIPQSGQDLWTGNDTNAVEEAMSHQSETSLRSNATPKTGNTTPSAGSPSDEETIGVDAEVHEENRTETHADATQAPVYRSRFIAKYQPKELAQPFFVPPPPDTSSPSRLRKDETLPNLRKSKSRSLSPGTTSGTGKTVISVSADPVPKTPSADPATATSDGVYTTPQNDVGPIIPVPVRRVVPESVFRSSPPSKWESKSAEFVSPESSEEEEDNSFLFGAIERTFGPRSASADLESLGGPSSERRTHRRLQSEGSSANISVASSSALSRQALDRLFPSETNKGLSMMAPRTLEYDLSRLEQQLATLKKEVTHTKTHHDGSPTTGDSIDFMSVATSSSPRLSQKQRMVVVVPPGKLGVVLANRRNGVGTVVAMVRESSALYGALNAGDKIVAIDGADVSDMMVADITALMAKKAHQERHLTVLTPSKVVMKPSEEVKSYSP